LKETKIRKKKKSKKAISGIRPGGRWWLGKGRKQSPRPLKKKSPRNRGTVAGLDGRTQAERPYISGPEDRRISPENVRETSATIYGSPQKKKTTICGVHNFLKKYTVYTKSTVEVNVCKLNGTC